jgi:hypothetical protein
MNPQTALALGGIVFTAGGGWFLLKQLRKEVAELRRQINGIGGKVREQQALKIAIEQDPAERIRMADKFFGVKP